jgi:nucleoside-diphosphate-sugar epimerase
LANITPNQLRILEASVETVLTKLDLSRLAGKSLFITGGTGFFGLWLLSTLRALNASGLVINSCVLSRNPEAFLSKYEHFRGLPWLSFISGNIRDFEIPRTSYDLLLHAATETSLQAHANHMQMLDDIIHGTSRVMELAKSCEVSRMLLVSSGAVYGLQPFDVSHQPDESMVACSTVNPANAYGEGKRVMELLGAITQETHGIKSIVARCFAFCGPGLPLDGHFALGNFVRDALFEKEILIKGDGMTVRSYLYGADLAIWLLKILLDGEQGKAYNVGSDQSISISELASLVRDLLSPDKKIQILRDSYSDTSINKSVYVPSTSRAKNLNCQQWTSLKASIRLTGEYWKQHGSLN